MRIAKIVGAIIVLVTGMLVVPRADAADVTFAGGHYAIDGKVQVFQLRSLQNPELCLGGSPVRLRRCAGVAEPDQFWWPRNGNTWTELVNARHRDKCLEAENGGVTIGKCFQDRSGHADQWWLFGPGDGNTFAMLPNLADPTLCLDAPAQLAEYHGGRPQYWRQ
jgi:hypothetical protein